MPESLKLMEFNDRELLMALRDLEASSHRDGAWVTAGEFAKYVGLATPNAARQVGARFAWMRSYGVLELTTQSEKDEDNKHRTVGLWRVTTIGEAFATNTLTGAEAKAFEAVQDAAALNAGMALGSAYQRLGYPGKMMMRRALRYQMGSK